MSRGGGGGAAAVMAGRPKPRALRAAWGADWADAAEASDALLAARQPVGQILAREGMAGASASGLRVIAALWGESQDTRKRAHLLSAVQNGARLDGRGWRMVPRALTGGGGDDDGGGGDTLFEFANPARRGSEGRHFARVSVLREVDGPPLVTAECEADPCESWQYVGWCRHAEHACRLVEATWKYTQGLEREEDLDVAAFWACAWVRAQTPPIGAPEVGRPPSQKALPAQKVMPPQNYATAASAAVPAAAVPVGRRGGYAALVAAAEGTRGRGFTSDADFVAARFADFGD